MKVLFLLKSEILNKNITFIRPKLKNMKNQIYFLIRPPKIDTHLHGFTLHNMAINELLQAFKHCFDWRGIEIIDLVLDTFQTIFSTRQLKNILLVRLTMEFYV